MKEKFKTVALDQVKKMMLQFIDFLNPTVKEEWVEKVTKKHKFLWRSTTNSPRSLFDRDFLGEADSFLHQMRKRIVICEPNHEFHMYNKFLTSDIFANKFSEVDPEKVKTIFPK